MCGKRYRANISINNKKIYLGMFSTPTEAGKRYQDALIAKHSGNWKEWVEENLPTKVKV